MIYYELVAQLASILSSENVAKSCDIAGASIAAASRQQAIDQVVASQTPIPPQLLAPHVPGSVAAASPLPPGKPGHATTNVQLRSNMTGMHRQRAGKHHQSLRGKLCGKTGKIRRNAIGKRVDMSARTVATPNPMLNPIELDVPVVAAMKLSDWPIARWYNMHELTAALRNGPHIHPGMNFIKTDKGVILDLTHRKYSMLTLEMEWIPLTHMTNGKEIDNGRYPSLHKVSLMGYKARITDSLACGLPASSTTPLNADFDGDELNQHLPQSEEVKAESQELMGVKYNILSQRNSTALIYPVQDTPNSAYLTTSPGQVYTYDDAMQYLMQCPNWDGKMPEPTIRVRDPRTKRLKLYVTGCDLISAILPLGTFVLRDVKQEQQAKATIIKETEKERNRQQGTKACPARLLRLITPFLDREEISSWARSCKYIYHRLAQQPQYMSRDEFTSWQQENETPQQKTVREQILWGKTMADYMTACTQNGLRIQNGYLCYGQLTKEKIRDIVTDMAKDPYLSRYSNLQKIPDYIHDLEQLLHATLMDTQITFGVEEMENPAPRAVEAIIEKLCEWIDHVTLQKLPYTEEQINMVISYARKKIENIVIGHAHRNSVLGGKRDGFFEIVSAGGKGNAGNIVQIRASMLQQYTMGKRFTQGVARYKGMSPALWQGLIKESLSKGLSASSHMYHARGGREGIADTAVKVRDTGYCERKLTKGAGGHFISTGYTVSSGDGKCCQLAFGDTNMDVARVERSKLTLHMGSIVEFEQQHRIQPQEWSYMGLTAAEQASFDKFWQDLQAHRLKLQEYQLKSFDRQLKTQVLVPTNFEKLWHRFPIARDKGKQWKTEADIQRYVQDSKQGLSVGYIVNSIYRMLNGLRRIYPLTPYTYYWSLVLEWLSPKRVILEYQWSRNTFDQVMSYIEKQYCDCMLPPGEMQGINSAQVMSELITQLTFNSFHFAGADTGTVGGIVRLKELINMQSNLQTPALTIVLNNKYNTEADANRVAAIIPCVYLKDITLQAADVRPFDCPFTNSSEQATFAQLQTRFIHTQHENLSQDAIFWRLDKKKCIAHKLTPRMVVTKIQQYLAEQVKVCLKSLGKWKPKKQAFALLSTFTECHQWLLSHVMDTHWMVVLRLNEASLTDYQPLWNKYMSMDWKNTNKRHFLGIVADAAQMSVKIKGIKGIVNAQVSQQKEDIIDSASGKPQSITRWVIRTAGNDLFHKCSV